MTQETLEKAMDLNRSLHFVKLELNRLKEAQERTPDIDAFGRGARILYRGVELDVNNDKAEALVLEQKQKLLSEINDIEKELAKL